jgi:flagellar basal-body rod protein FlgF
MSGLIDSASAILLSSEKRLEASAQNVANATTSGFKRQVGFSQALDNAESQIGMPIETQFVTDYVQGKLNSTGNPLDLAIHGPGLLMLRDGESHVYSRGGTFAKGENDTLIDALGRVLQQAGGGDLAVKGDAFEVLEDGTLLKDGLPTARMALLEASDPAALKALGGSSFAADPAAMTDAGNSIVRQGFLEASNVVLSDEMVAMMATVRQAEGGARLVQFYDQMIGQAITTFTRSGR